MKRSGLQYFIRFKLPLRIKTAFKILFKGKKSWVLFEIKDNGELYNLLNDDEFNMVTSYEGFRPYLINKLIKVMASNIDDTDYVLQKAHFEASAEYIGKTGKTLEED